MLLKYFCIQLKKNGGVKRLNVMIFVMLCWKFSSYFNHLHYRYFYGFTCAADSYEPCVDVHRDLNRLWES